jgi:hypothetical protein
MAMSNAHRSDLPSPGEVKLKKCLTTLALWSTLPAKAFGRFAASPQVRRNQAGQLNTAEAEGAMSRASDVLIVAMVVAAVVWLNVPKLLLPALFLTLFALSGYRWRREGKKPVAAERYRARLAASCVALVVVSVPLILGAVPPNGVYGFRVAATQSSPAIWYPANAFMGWALSVAAVISGVLLAILPATFKRWLLLATFLVPVLAAIAASLLYLNRLS